MKIKYCKFSLTTLNMLCITKVQDGMLALLSQETENGQIMYYVVILLIRNLIDLF